MQTIKLFILTTIILTTAVWSWSAAGRQQERPREVTGKSPSKETPEPKEPSKAEPRNAPKLSPTQLNGKLDPENYFIANTAIWEVGTGAYLGGMIETKKRPTDKITPDSRLTIKNLSNNVVLYERDFDGAPNSMYLRNVTPDDEPELIADLGIAASSNQFQIFAVTPSEAHLILNENYSQDATLIDLTGEAVDVLITTGFAQAAPLTTTLYQFKGDRYQSAGEISYKRMRSLFSKQFRFRLNAKD